MQTASLIVFSVLVLSCAAQRSPYAGRRPIGYPSITVTTTTAGPLANRFGDDTTTTTTRLPIEAGGDADLVRRLLKMPVDQQPFWLINWQALEAHRNNPQTYTHNQNSFIDNNNLFFPMI